MPNIASAKKNMRKSRAATARNRAQRSALRTALKKAKAPTATADERTQAVTLLDRAGAVLGAASGTKEQVADAVWDAVGRLG